MNLTPGQIELLPEQQKAQVVALQAQMVRSSPVQVPLKVFRCDPCPLDCCSMHVDLVLPHMSSG